MQFSYKAKTSDGRIKYGKLEAKSRMDLARNLRKLGLTLVSFSVEGGEKRIGIKSGFPKFLKRVSVVDKMLFARHLHVMLKSGLSFSRALMVLAQQTGNAYFREILEEVREDVQKGNSLADSLAKYPNVFNDLFVGMIRVGETGGNLEEVLDMLAVQLKKEHDLISKVRGAMIYPAVIVLAMMGIGTLMMIYVVPSLVKVFEEMNVELPFTTQMIISVSEILQSRGIFVLLGMVFLVGLFLWAIKTSKGKKVFDYFLLHAPLVGGIVSKVNMARFSRTLSSLTASGVSIVKALEIISGTLGNVYYQECVKEASKSVQKGIPLSEVIGQRVDLFQPLMVNMIEVGEETGTLEETLREVAEFYEEDVEQVTSNLSSVIEPLLVLIIGGAVGFFAISMIQPMYSIMGTI